MLAVGSPGGSNIPTTIASVIVNVVEHGMDVTRAVGAGRVHHQYLPDELLVDHWGLEERRSSRSWPRGIKSAGWRPGATPRR